MLPFICAIHTSIFAKVTCLWSAPPHPVLSGSSRSPCSSKTSAIRPHALFLPHWVLFKFLFCFMNEVVLQTWRRRRKHSDWLKNIFFVSTQPRQTANGPVDWSTVDQWTVNSSSHVQSVGPTGVTYCHWGIRLVNCSTEKKTASGYFLCGTPGGAGSLSPVGWHLSLLNRR